MMFERLFFFTCWIRNLPSGTASSILNSMLSGKKRINNAPSTIFNWQTPFCLAVLEFILLKTALKLKEVGNTKQKW